MHNDLSGRTFFIDVWRGIAICAILLLHAYAMIPGLNHQSPYDPQFNHLGLGVHLFFVLSGFLISESWDRCTTGGVIEFWVRRAAKIAPLYYLFLVLGIGTFLLVAAFTPTDKFPSTHFLWQALNPANLAVHMSLLQGLFPSALESNVAPGTWSIVNEAYFYLLYPLIRKFLARGPNSAVAFWIAATVAANLLANGVWSYGSADGYPAFQNYYFLGSLPDFALGMILYWVKKRGFDSISPAVVAAALATLFLSIAWFQSSHLFENSIFLPALAPFILLVRWPQNAATRLLQIFGRQTYALYFAHLFVLKWLDTFILLPLRDDGMSTFPLFIINLLFAFPLCFALSNYVFDQFDRCFLRLFVDKYLIWEQSRQQRSEAKAETPPKEHATAFEGQPQ